MSAEQARGLDPVLNGTAANTATANKELLMSALQKDASFGMAEQANWYQVTQAGFNFVDDQCRAYFDDLFFLNRGREQIKSGLAAGAQTTAALLALTGAAQPSLAIAAQAFGFAASATDTVAGTYLYALPPATTLGYVEKLQLAYRAKAADNRDSINSPATSYYVIQRYLNLCLPPTIEANITKQIASTDAVGVQAGDGALFSIETVSATPGVRAPLIKTAAPIVRPVFVTGPEQPIIAFPRKPPPPPPIDGGIALPKTMNKYDVSPFRLLVGLPPAGPFDRRVLGLLKDCLQSRGQPSTAGDTLSRSDVIHLKTAVDAKTCSPN